MLAERSSLRVALTLMLGGAVVAITGGWWFWMQRDQASHQERWFAPGPLGHERGRAAPPPRSAAFLTRSIGGLGSPAASAWGRSNGLTPALSFSENLASVFPPSLFAKQPEYFPMVNGKRERPADNSQYWNPDLSRPDVALHAARVARAAFVAEPDRVSFSLGVNDGLLYGESPELLAAVAPLRWFRDRPDYSNLTFRFMNRAAEELSRSHPDKFLGALAYYWEENTPDFPVHPQVLPFLTADRSQGYDRAFWREEFSLQERWAKAGPRRLGLYDYSNGYGFVVPRLHTRLIAENLRHARSARFTDYYCEGTPNWGTDGPMIWLIAQLLSDPNQNTGALLNEYYERYFQEAAAPMRRFFERCEEQWMRQSGYSYWLKHYRNESQADLFPSAVCAELRQLLDQAGRLARQSKVQARVALVSDAFGVTERFVLLNEVRTRLSRETVTKRLAGRVGAEPTLGVLDDSLSGFSAQRSNPGRGRGTGGGWVRGAASGGGPRPRCAPRSSGIERGRRYGVCPCGGCRSDDRAAHGWRVGGSASAGMENCRSALWGRVARWLAKSGRADANACGRGHDGGGSKRSGRFTH